MNIKNDLLNIVYIFFLSYISVVYTNCFLQKDYVYDFLLIILLVLVLYCKLKGNMGVVVPIFVVEILNIITFNSTGSYNSITSILSEYSQNRYLPYNIIIAILFVLFFQMLLGNNLGILITNAIAVLYALANLIKLHFHEEVFSMDDFKLIIDAIRILPLYLNKYIIAFIISIIVVLIILLIQNISIINIFRPKITKRGLLCSIFLFIVLFSIGFKFSSYYDSKDYNISKEYVLSKGFSLYAIRDLSGQNKKGKPNGYDSNIVGEVNSYATLLTENDNRIKPTVILILGESIYDIESVPNISFDTSVFPNLEKYRIANTISPSYGGMTVNAEWEALTGLSNRFVSNTIYTDLLSKKNGKTINLASEFKNNGYKSIAVHCNEKEFYNRSTVYENMGFDDFISKEDMNITGKYEITKGQLSDEIFVDTIIELEEETEEPLFISAVSMESHGPYPVGKYEEKEVIHSTSAFYDDDILQEAEVYATSAHNFDKAVGKLINYYESTNMPVLIYVYGDHLPGIYVNEESGYTDDKWKKYATSLFAYSNYTDVSVPEEYLSISYISTEIIKNSGIKYNKIYDVIYAARKNNPIVHDEFSVVEDSSLDLYNKITYDLTYGDKYLMN